MGFRINYNSTISIDGIPYLWSFGYSPNFDVNSGSMYGIGGYEQALSDAPNGRRALAADNGAPTDLNRDAGFITGEISSFNGYKMHVNVDDSTGNFFYHKYYNGQEGRKGFNQDTPSTIESVDFRGDYGNPTSIREMIPLFSVLSSPWSDGYTTRKNSFSPILVSNKTANQRRYGYKVCTGSGIVAISGIRKIGTSVLAMNRYETNGTTTVTGRLNFFSDTIPAAGDYIRISGASSGNEALNGFWQVVSRPTSQTFTFVISSALGTAERSTNIGTLTHVEDLDLGWGIETGYVEIRDSNNFLNQQFIPALSEYGYITSISNPTNHLLFGSAIAISTDRRLAVGAQGKVGGDNITAYATRGAVVLYDTSTITNSTPPSVNSVIIGNGTSARFGASLGIIKTTSSSSFQNKLYVGIPGQSSDTGQVNVYNMDSLMSVGAGTSASEYTAQRIAQITPSSLGYTGDPSRFGETIAVGDDIVAISAPAYKELGVVRGAVFLVNPKDQSLIRKIVCPAINNVTGFISNYVGNGTTTVTCNLNTHVANITAGQIIEISGAVGTEQSKLNGTWAVASATSTSFTFAISQSLAGGTYSTSSNNLGFTRLMKGNSEFGFSIAIGSGRIVIGDPYSDNVGNNSGYIYIYDYSGNLISARGPAYSDGYTSVILFGYSVAIGNGKIFVGAPGYESVGRFRNPAQELYRRSGMIEVYTLDGSFIQGGFPGSEAQYQDVNIPNWTAQRIVSYGQTDAEYQMTTSRSYPFEYTYTGVGWSIACGNDSLYVSAAEANVPAEGIFPTVTQSNQTGYGFVAEYRKITRAYTPYTALELQKGLI